MYYHFPDFELAKEKNARVNLTCHWESPESRDIWKRSSWPRAKRDLHCSHVLLSQTTFGSTFQKAWLLGTLANRALFWSHNKKSGDGRWLGFGRGARRAGEGAGVAQAPDQGGGAELTFPLPASHHLGHSWSPGQRRGPGSGGARPLRTAQ